MNYQINWSRFIDGLLIISYRKKTVKAWINALLKPIKTHHNNFLTFRTNAIYKVQHNSQITSIEDVLNDLFDNSLRRIRIQNVMFREAVYFYEPLENREVWFYEPEDNQPVYFYEEEDFSGEGVDFLVCVPPVLRPQLQAEETAMLTLMSGQIDYYKLYSKNYKIVWVQIED